MRLNQINLITSISRQRNMPVIDRASFYPHICQFEIAALTIEKNTISSIILSCRSNSTLIMEINAIFASNRDIAASNLSISLKNRISCMWVTTTITALERYVQNLFLKILNLDTTYAFDIRIRSI